jgi:chemotaxis signal transduction protein
VIDLAPSGSRAAELRTAFDRARAVPFASEAAGRIESFLAIRVCEDAYAIRISEISGLANDRKIVPLPGAISELIGVAGIRGTLIAVYSLASLLGYGAEAVPGRWLALCGAGEPVALAFSQFEGYVMVPTQQVCAAEVSPRRAVSSCASNGAEIGWPSSAMTTDGGSIWKQFGWPPFAAACCRPQKSPHSEWKTRFRSS